MTNDAIQIPGRKEEELTVEITYNLLKHLGVQMYAGRTVPAIAELISNSWDADATEIKIAIPLGVSWGPDAAQKVVIEDNGHGMSWAEVRDMYLKIGKDRRRATNSEFSRRLKRPVQGRKGVGKLAGFGIARRLEIQTVAHDPLLDANYKPRETLDPDDRGPLTATWISLELNLHPGMADESVRHAEVHFHGPAQDAPADCRSVEGTTAILSHLIERVAVNEGQFHWSLARRFLELPNCTILVNGDPLQGERFDNLEVRIPQEAGSWKTEDIPGLGTVDYWIGFQPNTIQTDTGKQFGIFVYARGKVAQDATVFDLGGGTHAQHGLRYLTGQIKANWLDKDSDAPDLIATDRSDIAWESPQGRLFKAWGQDLLRGALRTWVRFRGERNAQVVGERLEASPNYQRLNASNRKLVERFTETFQATGDLTPAELQRLVDWFVEALEDKVIRSLVEKIRSSDKADLEALDQLLSQLGIRTATSLLHVLEANVEAIAEMRKALTTQEGFAHLVAHVARYPWLLNVDWILSKPWAVDTSEVNLPSHSELVSFRSGNSMHLALLMPPSLRVDPQAIVRLDRLRKRIQKAQRLDVQAHLFASDVGEDAQDLVELYQGEGRLIFKKWTDVLASSENGYRQFIDFFQRQQDLADDTSDLDVDGTEEE